MTEKQFCNLPTSQNVAAAFYQRIQKEQNFKKICSDSNSLWQYI